jgi:hypothetical protein
MLGLRTFFGPVQIPRVADGGRVFCPVQGQDIDVDRCAGCSYLHDANEPLSRFACRIPNRTLRSLGRDW